MEDYTKYLKMLDDLGITYPEELKESLEKWGLEDPLFMRLHKNLWDVAPLGRVCIDLLIKELDSTEIEEETKREHCKFLIKQLEQLIDIVKEGKTAELCASAHVKFGRCCT